MDDREDCRVAKQYYRETLQEWREGSVDRHDLNEAYREYLRECDLSGRGQRQQHIIVLPRHGGQVLVYPDGGFGFNGRRHDYNGLRGQMNSEQWDEWLDIQRERLDMERGAQEWRHAPRGQGGGTGGSGIFHVPLSEASPSGNLSSPNTPAPAQEEGRWCIPNSTNCR